MKDINSHINDLRRPKMLVRAARHGMDSYRRGVHLKRYISITPLPSPSVAIMQLLDIEKEINTERLSSAGTYAPARHIDVLVAIMAEAQLMRATQHPRLVFG